MKALHALAGAGLVLAAWSHLGAQSVRFTSASVAGMCLGRSGNSTVLSGCGSGTEFQFSGYGAVQSNGQCLTAMAEGSPLAWTGCNNSASQKWGVSGKLNNEQGWCADIKGEGKSAGTPIIAYKCNGQANQRWSSVTVKAGPPAPPSGTFTEDAIKDGEGLYARLYGSAEQALNCAGFIHVEPTRPPRNGVGTTYVITPHPAVKHAAEVDARPPGRQNAPLSGGELCGYLKKPEVLKYYRTTFRI